MLLYKPDLPDEIALYSPKNRTPLAKNGKASLVNRNWVASGGSNVVGHFKEKDSFLNPLLEAAGFGKGLQGLAG
jgi:hypothetical protein